MAKEKQRKNTPGERGPNKIKPVAEMVVQILPKIRKKRGPNKKPCTRTLTPEMKEKQWVKGQNPNPLRKGLPGGAPSTNPRTIAKQMAKQSTNCTLLTKAYTVHLTERCDIEGLEHLTWAEAIAIGISRAAARGETVAAKEIRESTEGRLPESVNLKAELNGSLAIEAKQKLLGKLAGG